MVVLVLLLLLLMMLRSEPMRRGMDCNLSLVNYFRGTMICPVCWGVDGAGCGLN
jgi:hypothetical protein